MKKSGVYLWVFVIAQGLALVFVLTDQIFGTERGSSEARIKSAWVDVHGGLKTALEMFKEDCGRYPTTAEGLKILFEPPKEDSLKNWRGPYLDGEVQEDPWGHEYVYRFPATYSANGYDLYSVGQDGVSNTSDDIGNWDKPASAMTIVYAETGLDRACEFFAFVLFLLSPLSYGLRLAVGFFSKRVRTFMSEHPRADLVWGLIAFVTLMSVLLVVPKIAG